MKTPFYVRNLVHTALVSTEQYNTYLYLSSFFSNDGKTYTVVKVDHILYENIEEE